MTTAEKIKQGVGSILRKNLYRDQMYRHETQKARDIRWDRARTKIDEVIELSLVDRPQAAREG